MNALSRGRGGRVMHAFMVLYIKVHGLQAAKSYKSQ